MRDARRSGSAVSATTSLRSGGRKGQRAEQILVSAARLFRESGYHGVGIDQIGESVGITGGGVYRHFRSKEQLLVAVVDRVVLKLEGLLETVERAAAPVTLRSLAELTIDLAVDDRDVMSVYQHEMRSLPADQRARVRDQQDRIARVWESAIRAELPAAPKAELRYRTAMAIGLALTPVSFDAGFDDRRNRELLVDLVVASTTAAASDRVRAGGAGFELFDASVRRDRIVIEAVRLARSHGYQAVTIEQIGAAAGIDGSSVYRHFADKEEVFITAYEAAGSRLLAGIEVGALAPSLEAAVEAYIDQALNLRDLTAIWVTESHHLSGERARSVRRLQRTYIDRLTGILREARSDLDAATAELFVRAVFLLINGAVSLGPRARFSQTRLKALVLGVAQECLDAPLRTGGGDPAESGGDR